MSSKRERTLGHETLLRRLLLHCHPLHIDGCSNRLCDSGTAARPRTDDTYVLHIPCSRSTRGLSWERGSGRRALQILFFGQASHQRETPIRHHQSDHPAREILGILGMARQAEDHAVSVGRASISEYVYQCVIPALLLVLAQERDLFSSELENPISPRSLNRGFDLPFVCDLRHSWDTGNDKETDLEVSAGRTVADRLSRKLEHQLYFSGSAWGHDRVAPRPALG